MSYPFHIVDVFAERRYEGNQLAVVLDAEALSDADMRSIALETNFAETTFVRGGSVEAGFDVRIFTPVREMPFAGHPTLGTASVLRGLAPGRPETITLNLKVGAIPVRFVERLAWLTAPAITFLDPVDGGQIATSLGLDASDIDPAFPVQLVSSGPSFVFVPLTSLAALERARLDVAAFAPLADKGVPLHVYPVARGARDLAQDLTVRMFFDANGVREDAATGSAAACLGAYLSRYRYLGGDQVDVRVSQGAAVKRPSVLHVRASPERVEVGGQVAPVAVGELLD